MLLEELEGWAEILKGEPEVIHRLAAFEAAVGDAPAQDVEDDLHPAVPQIEGPAP